MVFFSVCLVNACRCKKISIARKTYFGQFGKSISSHFKAYHKEPGPLRLPGCSFTRCSFCLREHNLPEEKSWKMTQRKSKKFAWTWVQWKFHFLKNYVCISFEVIIKQLFRNPKGVAFSFRALFQGPAHNYTYEWQSLAVSTFYIHLVYIVVGRSQRKPVEGCFCITKQRSHHATA